MKYLISATGKVFSSAECAAEYLTEELAYDALTEMYQEHLDCVYGKIDICGYTWNASLVFERVFPIAFRRGVSDFKENLRPSLISRLASMDIDNEEFCCGFIVVAVRDEVC